MINKKMPIMSTTFAVGKIWKLNGLYHREDGLPLKETMARKNATCSANFIEKISSRIYLSLS